MKDDETPDVRQMEDGTWFWLDKALLHYPPKIGTTGLAVYTVLASFANEQQSCYPSQERIARMLGCSRSTVNRAIKTLESAGLIAVERGGSYPQLYYLLNVRCCTGASWLSHTHTLDVAPVHTNNNKLTRYINNRGDTAEVIHKENSGVSNEVMPAVGNEPLAQEIADALGDGKNLHVYLSLCRKFPASLLRRALTEAKEVPSQRIRKSRAALFKYLVSHYAEQSKNNPSR